MLPKHNSQISRETLLELGFDKLVQEFDDHEASREGLGFRELTPKALSKHFEDLGLDPEIANHNEISGLSGGQKVKVVIAGAMWNNPHLLVLDEPTNFLDRDSLGGLAVAIRDYKGGVIMISHNEEFVGALCPEQWYVADGRVTHKGHLAVAAERFEDSSRPGSGFNSSVASSAINSASTSAVNSGAEDNGDMAFKAKKKKKMTKKELKEREVRRRLRHIECKLPSDLWCIPKTNTNDFQGSTRQKELPTRLTQTMRNRLLGSHNFESKFSPAFPWMLFIEIKVFHSALERRYDRRLVIR
jgi:elongation factor 3